MIGPEIERLIQLLGRLPGLGPRSARRVALHLLKKRETLMQPLSAALGDAARAIKPCGTCGNLDTVDPCSICADPRRDRGLICVVEDVADLWAMERGKIFSGRYHVLGGTLSALDGIGPDELNISGLVQRVKDGGVREVIVATNATVDGQT
ncbi:MAG: recombination protein RecR, partial [Proteobacteria bacterium]|nr:recombination protein RecR [Pseudomonadota bacterium]